MSLPHGVYEALLDESLNAVLENHPELRSVFGKLDPEEQPARLAAFVTKALEQALREEMHAATRWQLCNELISRIAQATGDTQAVKGALLHHEKPVLLEITPTAYERAGVPRPESSFVESSLFTGSPSDPQLVHELQQEMRSADQLDVLVSFIKWSGLRLLVSVFEEITSRGGAVRVITTSYMGASDPEAIEWLAKLPNTDVRISYDVERTRLEVHAHYSSNDIKAAFGLADLEGAGIAGVGTFQLRDQKAYVHLITFQKTEREFSPTTMYADYPISRELFHWESQSNTPAASETGQNLINHVARGFTILVFARDVRKRDGITVPFTYLGPATRVSSESERPIKFVYRLHHPMPAQMFEENRRGA